MDFAKGFAILTIVIYHYLQTSVKGMLSNAIMLGGSGVHLFLLMSGFGLSLSSSTDSAGRFYRRRFFKVLVPYYVFVSLLFVLNRLYPLYPGDSLYGYLGHILGYKMFDESIVNSFGGHFWFLSTIIQFYLVFPLIARVKQRLNNDVAFVSMAMAVSAVYWFFVVHFDVVDMWVFNRSFLQYFWEFCAGMVLADLYRTKGYKFWDQRPAMLSVAAVLGIALMGTMAIKGRDIGRVLNDIPAAVGYVALVALMYAVAKRWNLFIVGPLTYLGTISYELYLTHMFVAAVASDLVFMNSHGDLTLLQSIAVLPMAIVVAGVYRKIHLSLIRAIATAWRN